VQGCTRTCEHSSNRCQNLTSLSDRIAAFIVDQFPPDGSPVELLCVDHNGTYVIPFPCHRVEDAWRNFETNEIIEADVAGWRLRGRKARVNPEADSRPLTVSGVPIGLRETLGDGVKRWVLGSW
jgi:hypothetical protein